jgi:maltose O-acetyltransferase
MFKTAMSRIVRFLTRDRRTNEERYLERLLAGGLVMGKNVSIQFGFSIDESHYWHIKIGDNVTIAPHVTILAHDASTFMHLGYTRIGKVNIGNRVFIGAGTIILAGVTVGDSSVIGAGSVVSTDIPGEVVAAGSPARVICSLKEFLEKHRQNMKVEPLFGEEYTIRRNVTNELKAEMNRRMARWGYVR